MNKNTFFKNFILYFKKTDSPLQNQMKYIY